MAGKCFNCVSWSWFCISQGDRWGTCKKREGKEHMDMEMTSASDSCEKYEGKRHLTAKKISDSVVNKKVKGGK